MAKLTIDPTAKAAYITLSDARVRTTKTVHDAISLDIDGFQRVVGVEILGDITEIEIGAIPGEPPRPER